MNRLTKAVFVATLTVALIASYAAATITVVTPTRPLFIGVSYFITWSVSDPAPTTLGIIDIRNTDNNNITMIDDKANLTNPTHNKAWVVNVIPGNYFFEINDGSATVNSGIFQVIDRNSSSSDVPAPTGGNTGAATTPASPTTTGGNTGATTAATTTTPSKSGASILRSNLIGLFVGLGVVALVMIQLF
ncbi:8609_t:CDS:2 [Acaulospora morrowiae]|uniref:8609_t:CDS:1 n=1 Tax=Acaulospora morrowiae TaxID=94023 RepID=A0A9N9NA79_9GLOM|nr:8609_t:CDS:2 [Acaulospora morrowiae]